MIQFVHVGMPKSASTWLQEAFFAHHPQLAVLGTRRGAGELHGHFIREVRRLVRGGDLSTDVGAFAREVERLAGELQALLRGQGRSAETAGISSEVLAGDWPAGRNARFIAESLARSFPGAKVVLILREQRAMLESSYKEYVRQGGTTGFRRFVLGPAVSGGFLHDGTPRNSHVVEYFKFSRLVALYQDLFGVEQVHVDCMEHLVADPPGFANALADFLGVEHMVPPAERTNPQLSAAALGLLRRLNHLFFTHYHHRYGWMPLTRLLSATLARRVMEDWDLVRTNPDLLRQRVSTYLQHRLADGVLPPLDRSFLRFLPARRVRFDRLPVELRGFLLDEYRRDNAELAGRVRFDLESYGFASDGE